MGEEERDIVKSHLACIVSIATVETIDFLIERTNRLCLCCFFGFRLQFYNVSQKLGLQFATLAVYALHTEWNKNHWNETLRWKTEMGLCVCVFLCEKLMCTVYKAREQTEWNATKLNVICMQNSTDFVSFSLYVCSIVVFFCCVWCGDDMNLISVSWAKLIFDYLCSPIYIQHCRI